jgi:hypothetical protein
MALFVVHIAVFKIAPDVSRSLVRGDVRIGGYRH